MRNRFSEESKIFYFKSKFSFQDFYVHMNSLTKGDNNRWSQKKYDSGGFWRKEISKGWFFCPIDVIFKERGPEAILSVEFYYPKIFRYFGYILSTPLLVLAIILLFDKVENYDFFRKISGTFSGSMVIVLLIAELALMMFYRLETKKLLDVYRGEGFERISSKEYREMLDKQVYY